MSERRAHWSDDLIDAVFRIMDDYAAEVWRREHDHGTPTFDVIAAVEDWQKRQDIGGDWGTVAWSVHMYQHYVTSEAAIARVREFREELAEWVGGSLSVERVLHDLDTALDGDSDEQHMTPDAREWVDS